MDDRRWKIEDGTSMFNDHHWEKRTRKVKSRGSFFFQLPFSIFYFLSVSANADDIKDVKPPVDVPGVPGWVWVVLVVVAALAAFFLVKYFVRPSRPAGPPKASWEIALERLVELERRNLFAKGQVKDYFVALSDIIRRYIEDRFNIHAPEMTTEEFLNSLKKNPVIDEKHKETLKKFLILSDMVKFAKYGPDAKEAVESLELAKRLIRETTVQEPVQLPKA